MSIQGKDPEEISYETTVMDLLAAEIPLSPKAMKTPGPLSGNQGSVLDPIVAIRYKIMLEPE